MKHISFILYTGLIVLLTGCSAVEAIFKAGMIWAFFLLFVVIFAAGWIYQKTRKRK